MPPSEDCEGAISHTEEIGRDDHPLPRRTLLVRKQPEERVEKVLEVTRRYRDLDSECFEYALECSTHTARYRYGETDLEDCFLTTGETCELAKPVQINWVRAAVYGGEK
jgi:hypothetical protein